MTDLYIASDGAFSKEDESLVNEMRAYILSLTGFRNVIPIFRHKNFGASANGDKAIDEVFQERKNLILLEEDVVVGSGFLHYMNNCLMKYQDFHEIYAVSGFLDPRLDINKEDIFLMNRMAPYGLGLWKDKFYTLNKMRTIANYKRWFSDRIFFNQYEKFSPHSVRALPLIFQGYKLGDFETGIILEKTGQKVLYPFKTLTKSIGFDGSGLRSPKLDFLQNQKLLDNFFIHVYEIPAYDKELSLLYGNLRRRLSDKVLNVFIFYLINSKLNYIRLFKILRAFYKWTKRTLS